MDASDLPFVKILHVVGARPNFMKTAAVTSEMARHPEHFQQVIVHTGQHYDDNMSDIFFRDLDMPRPDEFLNVGSGTHAEQTARVLLALEPILFKYRPDWVFVVGDVNSTLASALVCAKLRVKVAHVEAGLRSGDRTMPEEINRLLTDQIADLLFTPSMDADENLLREGIQPSKIYFVGNVMIDTLVRMLPKAIERPILENLKVEPKRYILVTLHRPSNVDSPSNFQEILTALLKVSERWPVIFPVHPRTKQSIARSDVLGSSSRVQMIDPLGYLDFLALMNSAGLVLTDSGGVQEETTYLGVPCLTARSTTERPITVQIGTNQLVAGDSESIIRAVCKTMAESMRKRSVPELWDGSAAKRIIQIMLAR